MKILMIFEEVNIYFDRLPLDRKLGVGHIAIENRRRNAPIMGSEKVRKK
ncbi:MAG: hypothetical protein NT166_25640 [Candidatus Aminicenantes bacterium]|nr:hypothetical protein [Candidatus Aminicenantes bacterium]